MFVHVGINDTTALAAACVGVAMGAAGAAMAVNAADVVLMSDNLTKLPATISIAKSCNSIIIQNIALSVGIKLIAMALAMLGYLVLWEAICVDIGSLLIVLLNGLRPMQSNVCFLHVLYRPILCPCLCPCLCLYICPCLCPCLYL
jgi:Cd2+/Zn2+-exporting ATPase